MALTYPAGLYGPGMHFFILDEAELGTRVAGFLDMEANWDPDWITDWRTWA